MHVVAAPVLDGAPLFELGLVVEIFGADRARSMGIPWYDLRLVAAGPAPVRLSEWGRLDTPYGLDALDEADTIVVPPPGDEAGPFPPELLAVLRRAHGRGARIASICTGAFVLAEAGLLDGRPAITHWSSLDELARRHPEVRVQPAVLYVDDGDVLTSAGSAAGLDLCLHLVRLDHGAKVAGTAARWSVVPAHREGGQEQYVPVPVPEPSNAGFAACLDWARDRLADPIDVPAWARQANTSPRTFARRFRETTGSTPLQWLAAERVRRAQEELETTDLPVEVIAARCGFATAAGLRKHFTRLEGTTPQAYRRTFRKGPYGRWPSTCRGLSGPLPSRRARGS